MKKKIVSILLTSALAVGLLAGCGAKGENSSQEKKGASDEQELVTIRDAVMTGQLDQYATEIGLWQGFFEKHGINLETTEFVAGIYTIDAVVTGTADIGMMADYATVNRIGNTLDATDLVVFSELSGGGIQIGGLYVAPEYADDLSSLDGSTGFLTMTGTVSDYYVSKSIEYLGLDESKQNIIPTDSAQTQLALIASGDASAAYITGANTTYVEEQGWVLVATTDQLELETGAYFLAPQSFVDENAEALANYLIALDESATYIDEHLDECAEYLADKLGIVADDFKITWNSYEIRNGFSEEAALHLSEIGQWAYEHGRFEKSYDIRDFIDTQVVEIAFPDAVTVVK